MKVPEGALAAAATPLTGTKGDDPRKAQVQWQDEAWLFYDESGPLRYGATWVSNLISRARLCAATVKPGGDPEPIKTGEAADVMEALAGGIEGQASMLKDLGLQLTVPGLGYLVTTKIDDGEKWGVKSADELRLKRAASPRRPAIYEQFMGPSATNAWEDLPVESLIIKVWRPHPRYHYQSDSPARAALAPLRELRRISQYIDAVLASRIASAGLFIFPTEASFPTVGSTDQPQGKHPFVTEVMDVMMTAIKTPGTAASLVPIPVEVPGEFADKFNHLDFATSLSDKIIEMRESALRQCAIALDVPAEILTGMSQMSHWGSWQIEESAIKVHAEPLLEVVTGALTIGYLRPVLETMGVDTEGIVVWADTADMAIRPDRSEKAVQLYDRLEIGGEALRRETGMQEFDAPKGEELATMVFKKLVENPTLAAQAAEGLGIDLPDAPEPPAAPGATGGPETDAEPDSREAGADTSGPPLTRDNGAQQPAGTPPTRASVIVLEQFVYRALERAGNRIRGSSKNAAAVDCPPEQAHCCVGGVRDAKALLEGAWNRVPEVAVELGYEPVLLVRYLDEYCITLLERGFAYDRDSLAAVLAGLPALAVK